MGKRFAHQTFCSFERIDSRESIRREISIFEALGQIRANRVFSPIRFEIRAIRAQSSLLSGPVFGRTIRKKEVFFEARIDSRESAH